MTVSLVAGMAILKSAVRAVIVLRVADMAVSVFMEWLEHITSLIRSLTDSQERGDSRERLARRRHGDSQERGASRERLAARRHGGLFTSLLSCVFFQTIHLLHRLAGKRRQS